MALDSITHSYDPLGSSSSTLCSSVKQRRASKPSSKENNTFEKEHKHEHEHNHDQKHGQKHDHDHDHDHNLDTYFQRLEHLFHQFEASNRRIIDQQSTHLHAFVDEIRKEFVNGPMAAADTVVKYLESTAIGHEIADLALPDKVARAIDYIEELVEHSKVSNAIQIALTNSCDRLLKYEELPHAWRENPYITDGYRFCGSMSECALSIFKMHNETINIWSHVLGFVLFLGLALFHMPYTNCWELGTWLDRTPMIIFMLGAMKCLSCSVFWHSCCSISNLDVKRRMACVDYSGITVCICTSILTTQYSVLKCHPQAQAFYMFITIACSGLGMAFSFNPKFDSAGAKPLRALFFCCFAVFGSLSGIHAIFYRGVAETWSYYLPVLKSIMCYFVGVLFYATLFPERYIKGFSRNWGMSHNIWHCFVVAGIYYHYRAVLEMFTKAVSEVCAFNP